MDYPTTKSEAEEAHYNFQLQQAYKKTLLKLERLRKQLKEAGILVD